MLRQSSNTLSEPYRHHLAEALQQSGVLASLAIKEAFSTIPREKFVPFFYQQREGMTWDLQRASAMQPEQWLALVYEDVPLITSLNEQNWPISSSSGPTAMALMLEALRVEKGMRVLEIGTGTGYNAAMLAHLTGDPTLVTTVDLDEQMTRSAEQALQDIVGPVCVQTSDGRLGVLEHAPYDRIIATASASYIPRAWYEQLAPGGRLVMDLQGSLNASSFLVIEKQANGNAASGHISKQMLHFMPLRSSDEVPLPETRTLMQQPVAQEVWIKPGRPFPMQLQDQTFRWFLQWFWPHDGYLNISLPSIQTKADGQKQAFVQLSDRNKQTLLRLNEYPDGGWHGKQRGNYPLWQTIQSAYEHFLALGKPTKETYTVQLDSEQAELFAYSHDGNMVILRDLYPRNENSAQPAQNERSQGTD